jgi:hypothetical protein
VEALYLVLRAPSGDDTGSIYAPLVLSPFGALLLEMMGE